MDGTEEDRLEIPESAEFELNDLDVSWSDVVETDDDGIQWLATNDLPPNVEGVDHSLGGGRDNGEAIA